MNLLNTRSALVLASVLATALLYSLAGPSYSQDTDPQAGMNVAVVDIEKVLLSYKKHGEANKSLQAMAQTAEAKHNKLSTAMEKAEMILNDLEPDSDAWWQRKTERDALVLEIENHLKRTQQQFIMHQAQNTRSAYDAIITEVEIYGQQNKLDLVLWKKAPLEKPDRTNFSQTILEIRQRPILFASNRLDITKKITERLNKKNEEQ